MNTKNLLVFLVSILIVAGGIYYSSVNLPATDDLGQIERVEIPVINVPELLPQEQARLTQLRSDIDSLMVHVHAGFAQANEDNRDMVTIMENMSALVDRHERQLSGDINEKLEDLKLIQDQLTTIRTNMYDRVDQVNEGEAEAYTRENILRDLEQLQVSLSAFENKMAATGRDRGRNLPDSN